MKHINFDDSPVMRELARQAVKNGTIQTESVSDIVKKASATKSYQPTGDLYTDLFKLASGLRDRGFVKEADGLEDKILIMKQAESHLYRAIDEDGEDLLDFAHPDGDAKVSDAQEGNGIVETLPSAHQKMVDVVNKTPTGKYAKLIDDIILATAYALDVDLKKFAAEEDDMEEELSGKGSKKKELLGKINAFLADRFTKVNDLLKASYQEFNPPAWAFRAEDLLDPGSSQKFKNLYGELAVVNPRNLDLWKPKMRRFYGDENFAGDPLGELARVIRSAGNKEELVAWGNEAGQGVGNTYFSGSQPSKEKQEYIRENPESVRSPLYRDNPNSVWVWRPGVQEAGFGHIPFSMPPGVFVADENKTVAAARAINDALVTFYNSMVGPDKLAAASGKIQEDASKYFNELKEVAGLFEREPEIDANVTSLAPIVTAINETISKLQHLSPKGGAGKKFATLVDSRFGEGWRPIAFTNVDAATKEVAGMVDFLGKNTLTPGDALITDPKAANLFLATAKMYRDAEEHVKDPKVLEKFKKYKQLTYKLYKVLQNAQGRPYSEVAEEVKKLYPNATSYEKLLNEAQTWAQESSELTGRPADEYITAADRNDLVKLATPPGGDPGAAKPTAAPGSGKPAGGTPAPGQARSAPVKKTPDMEAVARMQFALSQMAGMINQFGKEKFPKVFNANDANFIWSTGPGKNAGPDRFDGKWGANTAKALATAKKYVDALPNKVGTIVTAEPRGYWTGSGHSKDVTAEAGENLRVLYAGMQAAGYSATGAPTTKAAAVYDKLPKNLQFSQSEMMSNPEVGGMYPVTSDTMRSMASLYKFLLEKLGVEPQAIQSDDPMQPNLRGLTIRKWDEILKWFMNRAKYIQSNLARDDAERQSAGNYHSDAVRLWNQLVGYGKAAKLTLNDMDKLLPENQLPGGSVGIGGVGGAGSAYKQGPGARGRGKGREAGGQDDMEGRRMQMAPPDNTAPPIGEVLDLRTEWWPDMNLQDVLRLDQFRRVPAARMAMRFFPDMSDKSDEDVQLEAIKHLGYRPVGEFRPDENSWVVQVRGPTGRPVNKLFVDLPKAEQTMSQLRSRDPLNNYQRFLNQLMGNLRKVYDDWMSQVDPSSAEASAVQDYYDRWVQGISKQYRDIAQQRRARG